MGACATKPLDIITDKAPVEAPAEDSTPRTIGAAPATGETTTPTEVVEEQSESVKEKDEEKPIEASEVANSTPIVAPEEQKIDNAEVKEEEKPVEVLDSTLPTVAPEEQKFETVEEIPKEKRDKEKEAVEHKEAEASLKEMES